jgi:hypothetical protein
MMSVRFGQNLLKTLFFLTGLQDLQDIFNHADLRKSLWSHTFDNGVLSDFCPKRSREICVIDCKKARFTVFICVYG